jgi:nitrilase
MLTRKPDIIALPSAFTAATGRAHWEPLVRARAIENLCYVIAAAQGGYHISGRETWGHSMIVDPWGTVLGELPNGAGHVSADLDIDLLRTTRRNFPSLDHRRIHCQL